MTTRRRDITKTYTTKQFVSKVRRLATGLKSGKQFTIQIANEKIRVPKHAKVNIEHERGKNSEEIEFQIVWERR